MLIEKVEPPPLLPRHAVCLCVNLLALNCSSWLKLCKNLNLHLLATGRRESKLFLLLKLPFRDFFLLEIFLRNHRSIVQANPIRNAFIVKFSRSNKFLQQRVKKFHEVEWNEGKSLDCVESINYNFFKNC